VKFELVGDVVRGVEEELDGLRSLVALLICPQEDLLIKKCLLPIMLRLNRQRFIDECWTNLIEQEQTL